MKYLLLLLLVFSACSFGENKFSNTELDQELERISLIEDEQQANEAGADLWNKLIEANQIPFTQDSTVIFLHRGEAESVSWNGDFNSWSGNNLVKFEGKQAGKSNIWYYKHEFPTDARVDYKITINESDWILDPANPYVQWSGFGPNSELRMPDWKEEALAEINPDIPKGLLWEPVIIESDVLGYSVSYWVYIPFGYENFDELNVIYTTDGQEYSDDNLGSMVTILDNLHHQQLIEPTIAVFVSPLDPNNIDYNRRMDEMGNNTDYISFFIGELIPKVETEYKISGERTDRAILGTSLGGLNATYFGFTRPDIFQKVAIQAPAYWYRDEIYDIVKASNFNDPDIFMSVGTIGDNTLDARIMKNILEEKDIEFSYIEVNEGHSWGAWRTQLDDILIQFFPK
jgi:enterochelin esterase family protein